MSDRPIAPPTADEWREAFLAVEDRLNRVESLAKVADFLAGYLDEEASEEPVRRLSLQTIAATTATAVFHLIDATKEADEAYYRSFNDLIGRENAAAKGGAR